MKKRVGSILIVVILAVGIFNIAIVQRANAATPTWDQYCSSCHGTAASFGPRTVAQINAALTSVSQMKNNAALQTLTPAQIQTISNELSGNTADTTPPTVTGFMIPAASNSLTVSVTTLTATDNVGVTGYMVTSTATAPAASSTKWSVTPPASFTFPVTTKSGAQTLYAWAKDAAKNVSLSLTAPVTLNLSGPDKTKPTVTSFVIPAASNSLTVPITTLTATDNVGVTAYMVTSTATAPGPSSTKWSATPPASFTFPATTKSGAKTVYAWAKDAAKNVSPSLSAQVTITLPVAPVVQNATSQAPAPSVEVPAVPQTAQSPTSQAAAPSVTPATVPQMTTPHSISDMHIWVGRWFKINVQNKGFYTAQSGLSSDRQSIPGYLKIWAWDPNNKVFQGDIYQYDSQLSQWVTDPLVLHYISGGDLDFMASSQVVGDLTYGFTARIQGTEANGVLVEATFRTLGGYHMQWDAQQGKHWAGWLVVTGKMVFESEVQIPANKIQH